VTTDVQWRADKEPRNAAVEQKEASAAAIAL